jgi:hypothetical protein
MTQITLDEALAGKLHGLNEIVQLCDPAGRVLGWFSPLVDMSEWEPVSPGASEEELDRRARSPGPWYTTEQVLEHLKNLDKK